jgi:hypothetical protein
LDSPKLLALIQLQPKPWQREELEGFHVGLQLPVPPAIVVLKLNPNVGVPIEMADHILDRDRN